jgi:PBP1b-binding outer membrane lipoprotein LpoB
MTTRFAARLLAAALAATLAAGCSKDDTKDAKKDAGPVPNAAEKFDKGTGPPKGKQAAGGFE